MTVVVKLQISVQLDQEINGKRLVETKTNKYFIEMTKFTLKYFFEKYLNKIAILYHECVTRLYCIIFDYLTLL